MKKRIKQCIGIDCGLKELVVALGVMDEDFNIKILSNNAFPNTPKGFVKLLEWSIKLKNEDSPISYLVEATGVYHERMAVFLHSHACKISVLLPNKSNAFMRTLSVKTITDKVSAQALSQFGLEKKIEAWTPPQKIYNDLRQLSRERDQLQCEITMVKNQLHAEKSGAWPNLQSIKRMKQRIKLLSKQVEEIEDDIKVNIENEPILKEKLRKICTIKGIGLITAVTIIAETNGFNLIRNKKQLVSYAGLDVIVKDSGISIKSKSRISKKGNKYLRKCLHYPALSAIRTEKSMRNLYTRLVDKHGIKMKGVVAVQKKLLQLVYVLWKNDTEFDPEYLKIKEQAPTLALGN